MKNVLATSNRAVLEQFACSTTLLAFDYDGTLAPIVDDPAQARMRNETRELVCQLSKLFRVIVISGRAQTDVLKRVRGMGVLEVIGNHGIEPWNSSNRFIARVQQWCPLLERRLAMFDGVVLEDKLFSLAVHYRGARDKLAAHAAILSAAAELDSARIVGGKQVVNIIPDNAPHKGTTLMRELARLHCDKVIYVGDDETDEDVFALRQPETLLSIRVGAKRASAAAYFVPNQAAVDELLYALCELRARTAPDQGVA